MPVVATEYTRSDGPLYKFPVRRPRHGARRLVEMPTVRVHPFVNLVYAEMRRQQRGYDAVSEASGVVRASIKAWKSKNSPGLATMTAVLNTLGIDLVPVPAPDVIPTEIADDLAALAAKLEKAMPESWAAIVSFAASQQLAREAAVQKLANIDEATALH